MVFIYILKLQNNKYYVGKTNLPNFRLNDHFKNNDTEWTKKYKPLEILKIIPNCDNFDEETYTLRYMDKYGIDNVRGGNFLKIELEYKEKEFIKKSLIYISNHCFKCGKTGHFVKDCLNDINITEKIDSLELSSSEIENSINEPLIKGIGEISDYDKGYNKGYSTGYYDNKKDVYENGHYRGYEEGYHIGYKKGFEDGYKKGYKEQYKKGIEEGYQEGFIDGGNKCCCIIL